MAMQDALPWPPQPPQAAPAEPKPPSRWRSKWPIAAAAVLVAGLVAGLLVWAPWDQAPVAPIATNAVSPTATSVLVSWPASKGGATIDHYLIMRDGNQIASVPASQTSYTDNGLTPGTTHRYAIIAESGSQRSTPSPKRQVTTITPSPVGLTVSQQTWTTAVMHWSPSPKGPAPSSYVVYSGTTSVAIIPGATGSYTITGMDPGSTHQYQVTARWGEHESGRSAAVSVATLSPPVEGSVPVHLRTTSTPGGGASLKVGDKWDDTWDFTSACTANQCTVTAVAGLAAPGFKITSFTLNMHGSGSGYAGTTKAHVTTCGSIDVDNTVNLSINADNGAVNNGQWTSWSGTMVLSSPYITASSTTYCPAQSWNFHVTGTSS
jgi:hypothetical protein